MLYNKYVAHRGDILRVTSTNNPQYKKHVGDNYFLVRVAGKRDVDLAGNEVGPMRYGFNLVNTNDGKARITESNRLYVTTADGINQGIPMHLLETHFNMRFRNVTSERVIAPEVNKAIQTQVVKQDMNGALLVAKIVAALLGSGVLSDMTHADTIDVRRINLMH